jgi:hypothetical protein
MMRCVIGTHAQVTTRSPIISEKGLGKQFSLYSVVSRDYLGARLSRMQRNNRVLCSCSTGSRVADNQKRSRSRAALNRDQIAEIQSNVPDTPNIRSQQWYRPVESTSRSALHGSDFRALPFSGTASQSRTPGHASGPVRSESNDPQGRIVQITSGLVWVRRGVHRAAARSVSRTPTRHWGQTLSIIAGRSAPVGPGRSVRWRGPARAAMLGCPGNPLNSGSWLIPDG